MWTCNFIATYLLLDTILLYFIMGVKTPLDRQSMVHHVIAFTNYYMAFWQQDFAVTSGAAFIILEISTPFVCLRWLFFHHGLKGSMI